MLIDSPYFPDELEALPGAAGRRGLRAGRAARHPRRLRPPARAAGVPGHALGRGESRRSSACTREPGRGPARAARLRRRVLREPPGAAGARRRCRRCRCRAASSSATASWSCTPPRATPPTGWRCSRARRACWWWATTCPTWRSRWISQAARSPTTARRWPGWRRWWRRPRRWCPATARRTTATRRCACSTRTSTTWTRWSAASDALPEGRDTKAQRGIHAENVERRLERRRPRWPPARSGSPARRTTWSPTKSSRLAALLVELDLAGAAAHVDAAQPEHRVAEVADLLLLELEDVPGVPDAR